MEKEEVIKEYEKSKKDIEDLLKLDPEKRKDGFMERIRSLDEDDEVYEYFVDTLSY